MPKGSAIICAGEPRGVFLEGIIFGTPYPGTVMEIKNTAVVGGRHTWQAWSKASGAFGLIAVLLEDDLQGFDRSTPYVSGKRGRLYVPARGEDLNMYVNDVTGTADDVAIGALFGVETGTGQLIANSAYAYPCFTALEAVTDPTADYWLWCKFNG